MRKYLNRKAVSHYLLTEVAGNFIGFIVGISATGIVSRFFETRNIKNLWGLTSKKTVVDKSTFTALEWIISIIVGFIVFEIFTKIVAEWVRANLPKYKFRFMRWMVRNQLHHRFREWSVKVERRRVALFAAMNQSISRRISRK
jgi:hypothetical protein